MGGICVLESVSVNKKYITHSAKYGDVMCFNEPYVLTVANKLRLTMN